jgi:hypothetical protein
MSNKKEKELAKLRKQMERNVLESTKILFTMDEIIKSYSPNPAKKPSFLSYFKLNHTDNQRDDALQIA